MDRINFNHKLSILGLTLNDLPDLETPASYKIIVEQAIVAKKVLKSAYRKEALKNHPDVGGNAEDMKKINAAYKELIKAIKVIRVPPPRPINAGVSFVFRQNVGNSGTTSSDYYYQSGDLAGWCAEFPFRRSKYGRYALPGHPLQPTAVH